MEYAQNFRACSANFNFQIKQGSLHVNTVSERAHKFLRVAKYISAIFRLKASRRLVLTKGLFIIKFPRYFFYLEVKVRFAEAVLPLKNSLLNTHRGEIPNLWRPW